MNINYTYTDADSLRTTVEPGEHHVKVVGFEFGMSNAGNEKLDLELVTECGVTLYDSIAFTPKSAWKMDTVLKCFAPSKGMALPAKGSAINIDAQFVEQYLQGGKGHVITFLEPYNGVDKTRIKTYLPNKGGNKQITPVAPQQPAPQPAQAQMDIVPPKAEENVPF